MKKIFIKICGITNLEDAYTASSLGADAVGFMMYEDSSRFIPLNEATSISKSIPKEVISVMVFVNPSKEYVQECLQAVPSATLQFHGSEDLSFCSSFNKSFIKAIQVDSHTNFKQLSKDFSSVKMLLLDSKDKNLKGGTGKSFEWDIISEDLKVPFILAGGLNSDNIEKALRTVSCAGVDVSTGVESSPGKKDPEKIKEFIEKVRNFNG